MDQLDESLSFAGALTALKEGKRVARKGWNGKGMFVFLVGTSWYGLGTRGIDGLQCSPYLAMKTADNQVVPWTVSQTDVLAEDWTVVP